jgi:hypothetical protein
LNDRFGVHIGPSGDFSDIQAGMSEIGTKSDHPQVALDVLKAATVAVHTRHSVLTLSATNCLSPVDNEQQLDALRGHYSTAP